MKLNRENFIRCQKQNEKSEYERSFKYLEQRVEGFVNNMKGLNETYTERQLKRDQLIKTLEERKNDMSIQENKIAMCMRLLAQKGIEQHEINKYERKQKRRTSKLYFSLVFSVFQLMKPGIYQQ